MYTTIGSPALFLIIILAVLCCQNQISHLLKRTLVFVRNQINRNSSILRHILLTNAYSIIKNVWSLRPVYSITIHACLFYCGHQCYFGNIPFVKCDIHLQTSRKATAKVILRLNEINFYK